MYPQRHLEWFPRMQAMSLTEEKNENEQSEMRQYVPQMQKCLQLLEEMRVHFEQERIESAENKWRRIREGLLRQHFLGQQQRQRAVAAASTGQQRNPHSGYGSDISGGMLLSPWINNGQTAAGGSSHQLDARNWFSAAAAVLAKGGATPNADY